MRVIMEIDQNVEAWQIIFHGKRPTTVAEATELRQILRDQVENDPGLFALFGFRTRIKKRAPNNTEGLRDPTRAEVKEAKEYLEAGQPIHEMATFFQEKGILLTANKLSQLGGARP